MGLKKQLGKRWIVGVAPEMPISKVARRALGQRFGNVLFYLPKAAKHADEDIEFVHQLRVATRRSVAMLQIFSELLPKTQAKKIRKQLCGLRRAAGHARDLDVLTNRLTETRSQNGKHSKSAARQLAKLRRRAQAPLLAEYKRIKKKDFKKRLKLLIHSIEWRGKGNEPCFATYARHAMRPDVDKFFNMAAGDLSETESLHRLRIAGKRVRYAMEVFAGAFDKTFRKELYPFFEEAQDKLGAINDHATASCLFETWRDEDKKSSKAFDELLTVERQEIDLSCSEFYDWWTPKRVEQLRAGFQKLLADQASLNGRPLRGRGKSNRFARNGEPDQEAEAAAAEKRRQEIAAAAEDLLP